MLQTMLAKAARLLGWLIQRSRDSLLPTSGRIYGLGENQHPIFQQISQTQRWMLRTRVISQATKFLCYRANNFHSSPSTVEGELLNQIIYRHCRLKTKNTEFLLVLFFGVPLEHQEVGASQAHPSSGWDHPAVPIVPEPHPDMAEIHRRMEFGPTTV